MKKKLLFAIITLIIVFSTVGLSWKQNGLTDNSSTKPNFHTQDMIWDVQLSIDLPDGNGAEFDESFFYVTNGLSNPIKKYDTSGNLIETFTIPGVTGLSDIAFDGEYMYGGNGSANIYQMNFVTQTLVSTISSPVNVRHIAYDEINDAFWVGSWSDPLVLVSRSGTLLNSFVLTLPFVTGTAYDNVSPGGPYLWIFDGGNPVPSPQLIHQFNISSGTFTGVTHDVLSDIGISQPNAVAGGLFSTADLIQGSFSLGGILVGSPCVLFSYELLNPIPVELVSFTAVYKDDNVNLKWETVTEVNNKGFEIQRKEKLKEDYWSNIGFIQGNGTTTQPNTYNFSYEQKKSGCYLYRLKQIDFDGTFIFSQVVEVKVPIPKEIKLDQNYPNPFNPSTIIKFTIPSIIATPLERGKQSQPVTLKVYDVLGNEVATLVNEEKSVGTYEVEFSADRLTTGIYFYKLKAGDFVETKKMVLLK